MKLFFGGFFAASILWAGILWAQSTGAISLFEPDDSEQAAAYLDEKDRPPENGETQKRKGRGRGRRSKRARNAAPSYPLGDGMSGDDLGAPGARALAMGQIGGEEQLSEDEINKGIDRVFNGIERCLVLVPSAAPTTGKVVVGMHIANNGQVTKVNLKGPKALVGGEAGACIRRVVKTIRFPDFDGPDMVAHYPITFE